MARLVYNCEMMARADIDDGAVCWTHSLSKNIELHFDPNGDPFIEDRRGTRQKHGDWSWLRSGYFLRWKHPFATNLSDAEVALVIFSPTNGLKIHLQKLGSRPDWRQGVMDPFGLLVIVAEEVFVEMSATINKVLTVLRYTERVCTVQNFDKSRS